MAGGLSKTSIGLIYMELFVVKIKCQLKARYICFKKNKIPGINVFNPFGVATRNVFMTLATYREKQEACAIAL